MNQLFNMLGNSSNPLKSNLGLTQQQSPLSQMSHLMEFIKTTSPEQAKAQVEQLIKERGITQQEFDTVKQQASEIAKALGIATVGDDVSQAFHAIVTIPKNAPTTTLNFKSANATSVRVANVIVVKVA